MKFLEKEIAGKGTTRYTFAFGKAEAQILNSLLMKAIRYMPKTIMTMTTEQRMRNMVRELKKNIPQMREGNDDYSTSSPHD